MAIYAQKTAFRSTANFPDFKVTGPINSGDFLIYSVIEKAFINRTTTEVANLLSITGGGGGSGIINNAANLGTGFGLFSGVNVDTLEFKSLIDGQGISINANVDSIELSNDIITSSEISVPDSFKIVIDNDNTTTNSAKLELYTNTNPANITLVPKTFNSPNLDITIITDPSFVNPGQIISATADFISLGFVPGMCLKISGTTEQDGIWEIASITTTNNPNDTITITVPFTDPTDAGLQPPTILEALFFNFTNNQTLVLTGRNLVNDGFSAGQTIILAGTTSNDGTYTIATVINDTITIAETFPAIGCDVGNINISVPSIITTTGFWVDEQGNIFGNSLTIDSGDININSNGNLNVDGDITVNNDLTVNNNFTVGGQTINDIVLSFFPDLGFITQTTLGNFTGRKIVVNPGLTITNDDGILGDPTIDVNDFDILLTGDINGTGTVTDLSNVSISTTLTNTTVVPGNYNRVTVDQKGRITNGINQAIINGAGITVINGDGTSGNPTIIANDFDLTFTGNVVGNGSIIGLTNTNISLTLEDITVPGTFNQVTIDSKGRVVSGSNITLSFLPLSGGIMSGNIDMSGNDIINPGLIDGRNISNDGIILDNLNNGIGFKVQTAPNIFVNRTINTDTLTGVIITTGDGSTGNPVIKYDLTQVLTLEIGEVVDNNNDFLLMYDSSQNSLRKINPSKLKREAFGYFYAQI